MTQDRKIIYIDRNGVILDFEFLVNKLKKQDKRKYKVSFQKVPGILVECTL